MNQMPLSARVIFSDWHGVLSREPFWTSIRGCATHRLHEQLEERMAWAFTSGVADDWMKGLLSSDQVIAELGIQLRGRLQDDFLARRLAADLARMKVNIEVFDTLRTARAEAMAVIATDNMDCFARAFARARARRRRPPGTRETLTDWAFICDDIICSSQTQALKSEDPATFFGPWLASHGISFTDAVLIDDRADNLAAFASHGGATIQWKMGTNHIGELRDQLRHWLDATTPLNPALTAAN
jgi:hypothetical protein